MLGLSPASITLAQLTMRMPVDRALDLGAGCGVQALHLATHAAHVVATDLNPRACAMSQLTAALNDVQVDVRQGSLYEPVDADTFENNLRAIVNSALLAGQEVWIAQIPPVFLVTGAPDTDRNGLIEQYNARIVDYATGDPNDDVYLGPDFYTYFIDKWATHYGDRVHPNALGYAAMATQWHDLLTP